MDDKREMTIKEKILESIKPIVEDNQFVSINEEQIPVFAENARHHRELLAY